MNTQSSDVAIASSLLQHNTRAAFHHLIQWLSPGAIVDIRVWQTVASFATCVVNRRLIGSVSGPVTMLNSEQAIASALEDKWQGAVQIRRVDNWELASRMTFQVDVEVLPEFDAVLRNTDTAARPEIHPSERFAAVEFLHRDGRKDFGLFIGDAQPTGRFGKLVNVLPSEGEPIKVPTCAILRTDSTMAHRVVSWGSRQ